MSLVKQIGRNIQGDIWPGLPKKVQSFLFFRIHNADPFRKLLKAFVPKITTAERALEYKRIIKLEHELSDIENRPCELKPFAGINIAFSSSGLSKLRKYILTEEEEKDVKRERNLSQRFREHQLRGGLFQKGMFADLTGEGWDDKKEISPEYHPRKDDSRPIDGVLMVTSKDEDDLDHQIARIKKHFAPSSFAKGSGGVTIEFFKERRGKVRTGENKGKEHFGFADGVSQPIIKDLDERQPMLNEPKAVEAGMILVGHGGDEMNQPKWAKDGSFLVFRDLQQLVPEFDNFLEQNATREKFPLLDDSLSEQEKQEKLAAHLMGRWKNGTPVDLNPVDDTNPIDETNENCNSPNNNFDYHPVNEHRCPFAAHTRKMRPRGDLDHDHAVIIRRSISYGNEVTPEERRTKQSYNKPDDRGLLFTCYQSDIRNGFNFLTTRWASNHHFPDRKSQFVGEHGPGIDAIVGQRLSHHPPRSIGLPDGKDPTEARVDLDKWVIQRGGEYFFSPSIEALETYLTNDVELAVPAKYARGAEAEEPEIRARL